MKYIKISLLTTSLLISFAITAFEDFTKYNFDIYGNQWDFALNDGNSINNQEYIDSNFWYHHYWNFTTGHNHDECVQPAIHPESGCGNNPSTHTGLDYPSDIGFREVLSYGFGYIQSMGGLNGNTRRNFGSVTVRNLTNTGRYHYTNILHSDNIDSSIENTYIAKKQFIGDKSNVGAGGIYQPFGAHAHIENTDDYNDIAGHVQLTSQAYPGTGNTNPTDNRMYDGLIKHYCKIENSNDNCTNNYWYLNPLEFISQKKEAIPQLSTQVFPLLGSFSVFGYRKSPIQGYLNLSGSFDESTILVRKKDTFIDNREKFHLLGGLPGNQGNIGTQNIQQTVNGIYGSNSYTAGDYFIGAYLMDGGVGRFGYPVKFSFVTPEEFIIDNDSIFSSYGSYLKNVTQGTTVPGYFLTADLFKGNSGASAKWKPTVGSRYMIEVHIPERGGTATSVRYKIQYNGTGTISIYSDPIDQSLDANRGEWVVLKVNNEAAIYDFTNNGYIGLELPVSGINSNISNTEKVAFDAIKFTEIFSCRANKSNTDERGCGSNNSPNIPTSPTPSSNLSGVSVGTGLSWTGGDPDGDAVTYDVYLAANDSTPDTLVCTGVAVSTCNIPGNLISGTTYYWKVIASDTIDTSESEIWFFITSEAPNCTYTVIEPNGGEDYESGTAQTIVWSHSGTNCSSNVKIELFNNGILDYTIASAAPNTDNFNWQMITGHPAGSNYRIRITDGLYIDESDNDFTITLDINQEPAPVIVNPVEGSVLSTGGFNINGTSSPGVGLKLSVYQNNTLDGVYCSAIYITGNWNCDLNLLVGDYRIDAYHYSTLNDSVISPVTSVNITVVDLGADIIFMNGMENMNTLFVLNDTGVTWGGDYSSGNNTTCVSNISANQDCHQGRDATHNDDSDGQAGFSFTKLDSNGNSLDSTATEWSCVRDNVTSLIWEIKTNDGGLQDKDDSYTWYNTNSSSNGGTEGYADYGGNTCYGYNSTISSTFCNTQALASRVNSQGLCGRNDWRVPSINELHSIVHHGQVYPVLDEDYFPYNYDQSYWTSSSSSLNNSSNAWKMSMRNAYVHSVWRANSYFIMLVSNVD